MRASSGDVLGGKYRLVRELGRGGMGAVYEAVHLRLGRRVAVKLVQLDGTSAADRERLLARCRREALASSLLSSRHVVEVFDVEMSEGGIPYLVMELLAGQDLAHRLRAPPPPSMEQVVGWIVQAASAMAQAHEAGIVHRDLKPSNLFLCGPDEVVKVVGFGVSKILAATEITTESASVIGTPQYMAPEQLRAERVDGRADIYALGMIAYRALSGSFPFRSREGVPPAIAALAWLTEDPKPLEELCPELPTELSAAVMKAIAREPDARFASARELGAALEPFAGGVRLEAPDGQRPPAEMQALVSMLDQPLTPPRVVSAITPPTADAALGRTKTLADAALEVAPAMSAAATTGARRATYAFVALGAATFVGIVLIAAGSVVMPGRPPETARGVPGASGAIEPASAPALVPASPATEVAPSATVTAAPASAAPEPSAAPSPAQSARATGTSPRPPGPARTAPSKRGRTPLHL